MDNGAWSDSCPCGRFMESMRSSPHPGGPTHGGEAPDGALDLVGAVSLRRPTTEGGAIPSVSGSLYGIDRCIRTPDERGLIYITGPREGLGPLERHIC